MLSAGGAPGPALPVAWPGLCRADLRGPAPRPTLLGRKVWALRLHVGRQGGRGQLQVPPTCPLQGCPEAQPGRQAKEAPPAPGPRCPRHLHLPHGLQRGPAAVAAPCAPLLAQGQLQGQGQPEQCWKGRPNPDLGVASGAGARPGCEARWMALASFPGASGGGRGSRGADWETEAHAPLVGSRWWQGAPETVVGPQEMGGGLSAMRPGVGARPQEPPYSPLLASRVGLESRPMPAAARHGKGHVCWLI